MVKYLIKRLLQTLLVMVIVAIATFFLTSLLPGDPVFAAAGTDDLNQEQYDALYYSLGYDKPIIVRFANWAVGVLRLDFGTSFTYKVPVWELIQSRVPVTLYLSFLSMIISVPIGILFGIITAVNRGKKSDTILTLTANISACLPQFWIGICLMYIFGLRLGWLPAYGLDWWWNVGMTEHIRHLLMPLFCVSLGGVASFTRQTRSSMLEVIRQDYVRTARSKGVMERRVIFKHVLRNGLIPIVTILGSRLAFMIGGSMFVENVFTIPGMGMLIMRCINTQDIPTIQALVMITAFVTCTAYLITDIMYVAIDPRISLTSDTQ